jgi:hypothetical protein
LIFFSEAQVLKSGSYSYGVLLFVGTPLARPEQNALLIEDNACTFVDNCGIAELGNHLDGLN